MEIVILLALLLILVTVGLTYTFDFKKLSAILFKRLSANKKPSAIIDNDWDREWLSAEKERHSIVVIEPATLYLLGNRKHTLEGFRFRCICGGSETATSLEMLEHRFQKHIKAETDKALAAIGRFR